MYYRLSKILKILLEVVEDSRNPSLIISLGLEFFFIYGDWCIILIKSN